MIQHVLFQWSKIPKAPFFLFPFWSFAVVRSCLVNHPGLVVFVVLLTVQVCCWTRVVSYFILLLGREKLEVGRIQWFRQSILKMYIFWITEKMADYYFLIKEQITVWESQNVKPKVYKVIFFKAFHEEVFQGDFCPKRFDWPPDPSDLKKAVCLSNLESPM